VGVRGATASPAPTNLEELKRAAEGVWIWFADNGNIRKWQTEPFAEGTEYLSRAEHDRIIAKQASAARTLQASTLAQVQHLEDRDRSEYIAGATLDSEREANQRLTEENDRLRSELEAERERNEWRPIETAPRDGTDVFLWRAYSPPVVAGWFSSEGHSGDWYTFERRIQR
jgi:hypothetical protein